VPTHVRVSNTGGTSDSHLAGRARVFLKVGAIGYVSTRHGIDTDAKFVRIARTRFRISAIEYYEAVTGADPKDRPANLQHLIESGSNGDLEVAGVAYVNARHGVDADVGMSRVGLAILAQAAMNYGHEVLTGTSVDPKKRPVDPYLQIGNGA
jgi:hypothetical protein